MPLSEGLKAFVRKDQPTDEEWFGLIEARRKLIRPHLNSFTLSELGSLRCMRSEISGKHDLNLDAPSLTGDRRFSLKTQGIFYAQPLSAVEVVPMSGYCPSTGGVACPDGILHVWGLTRSGTLVLATISFVGERGYKGRGYERAKTIEFVAADLPTISAKTKDKPRQMWTELGEAIKGWAERRKRFYNQALVLAQTVEAEELTLSYIGKES